MRGKILEKILIVLALALIFIPPVLGCNVCEVTITKQALYSGYNLQTEHYCIGNGQTYAPGVHHSDPTTGLQLQTFYQWWIQIQVCTPYTITNVRLSDRFGAEFAVELVAYEGGTGGSAPVLSTQGNSEKVFLKWFIGTLQGGTCATIWLHVWTDHNPAGKQEFTSYGTYYLNSGAVVKWLENCHEQHSLETTPLMISTVAPPC